MPQGACYVPTTLNAQFVTVLSLKRSSRRVLDEAAIAIPVVEEVRHHRPVVSHPPGEREVDRAVDRDIRPPSASSVRLAAGALRECRRPSIVGPSSALPACRRRPDPGSAKVGVEVVRVRVSETASELLPSVLIGVSRAQPRRRSRSHARATRWSCPCRCASCSGRSSPMSRPDCRRTDRTRSAGTADRH